MTTTIALVGNPNSGKTTLFNQLTGNHQYVGNWPGVTVEKKVGIVRGVEGVHIVDLPGIYSLSPYTKEEVVARKFLSEGDLDVIINIVDATNLERNLFLTEQLMEFGKPVVIALNQMDIAEKRGYLIKDAELAAKLGVPVVKISALKGTGIDECVTATLEAAKGSASTPILYSEKLEEYLSEIESKLPSTTPDALKRYFSVKAFERDHQALSDLGGVDVDDIVARRKPSSTTTPRALSPTIATTTSPRSSTISTTARSRAKARRPRSIRWLRTASSRFPSLSSSSAWCTTLLSLLLVA